MQAKNIKNSDHTFGQQLFSNMTLWKNSNIDFYQTEISHEIKPNKIDSIKECKTCLKIANTSHKALEISNSSEVKQILFVSDLPTEDPEVSFSGETRELLQKMITAMKLHNSEYAFSTLAKCSPIDSKDLQGILKNCRPNFELELQIYKPKVVITLGNTATQSILHTSKKLNHIHGHFFDHSIDGHSFKVVPTFHPSYLLINPDFKRPTWEDLQKVMKYLGE